MTRTEAALTARKLGTALAILVAIASLQTMILVPIVVAAVDERLDQKIREHAERLHVGSVGHDELGRLLRLIDKRLDRIEDKLDR